MKPLVNIIGMVAFAVVLSTGCQPSDTSSTDTSSTDTGSASEAVQTEADQPTLQETVAETAETAKQVASDANDKAQELLTQAQNLVGEKKYEEAGNLLQKLANMELTPEQQKMLDDLKATIQKALQSDAVKEGAKAIGNMMGGDN